jgi:hypothetical protein
MQNPSDWFLWESLRETLGLSMLLGYALFVWFRTNAFVEYITLFKLDSFFYVSQYNELASNGYSEGYVLFLKEYFYDNFFIRLVTCPICLGFWLGLLILLFFGGSILLLPFALSFYGFFNKLI